MTDFFELTPSWPIRKPDHAERPACATRMSSASRPSGLPCLAIREGWSEEQRPIVTFAAFATKLGGSAR